MYICMYIYIYMIYMVSARPQGREDKDKAPSSWSGSLKQEPEGSHRWCHRARS